MRLFFLFMLLQNKQTIYIYIELHYIYIFMFLRKTIRFLSFIQ